MTFLNDDFLLHSQSAKTLYHDYAKHQPIYDYHCHLSPQVLADNQPFHDLTDIWLSGDHYKWRAMRTLGVDERLITGDANPYDKFLAYATCVPDFIGNPLYHWTHLELARVFGMDTLLDKKSAPAIWQHANDCLTDTAFLPRELLQRMKVKMVGTTDDPCDSLTHHATLAADNHFQIAVRPSFRPDNAIHIDKPTFADYIKRLSAASDVDIRDFNSLCQALLARLAVFCQCGCVATDHGLEILRFATPPDEATLNNVVAKRLQGKTLTDKEIAQFQTTLLVRLARAYHQRGLVMQLHIGPIRNTNQRGFNALGVDSGYDSIGDTLFALPLARLLSAMDSNEQLPKTILYGINPRDNHMLATMASNFHESGVRGKVQFGAAWWFNDQKDGIINHLNVHAQMGLLSVFVGMLTDSRSFLSYPRHEYFRRLLCNVVGQWVVDGEVPNDMPMLGKLVNDICYTNAKSYFEQR